MITACYVLHYGKEWIYHSILSVANQVDELCFFYTPIPSFGFTSNITNPDEEVEVYWKARDACDKVGKTLHWWNIDRRFAHEGEHRTFAVDECYGMGADMVLVVDEDELWPEDVLRTALQQAKDTSARTFRIGMRHLWRSVYWICDDPACPIRIIKWPGSYEKEEEYLPGKVFHMGYAQSSALVRYKMSIHGHKADLRPGWFENTFMRWSPDSPFTDVHPTNENFWNPVRFTEVWPNDALSRLTDGHPYRDLELIP